MTIQIHVQGKYSDGTSIHCSADSIERAISELENIQSQEEAILQETEDSTETVR